MTSASENWTEAAFDGTSTRLPHAWEPEPGDELAGEVVELHEASRGRHGKSIVVTIRAETGSLRGEPVFPGDWYAVDCYPTVLRRWVARDKPAVGDKAAAKLRGKRRGALDYIAGVYREPADTWA